MCRQGVGCHILIIKPTKGLKLLVGRSEDSKDMTLESKDAFAWRCFDVL